MCETNPDDYWVFSKMADLLSLICIPWSSTFQDGGWVKFPTLGTFRMSNSLPACASLGVIPVGCNGFDSCNVWISALEPSWTFVTSFIYRLIFTFNPQRLCDGIGWGIRSQFFPIGFFGFSYQAAHVNSLAWVTLFRNICIPFFSYDGEYLEDNKHSGSQFELHTHSRLLVVNINRKKHSSCGANLLKRKRIPKWRRGGLALRSFIKHVASFRLRLFKRWVALSTG